jgi:hypothetical protein
MTSQAIFPDVDLSHPWVKDYRVPFMFGRPAQNYFVVLQVPLAGTEGDRSTIMTPTEDEVKIISSYIDFKVSNYGYTEHFKNIVRQRPLDIDDIVNTTTFRKWSNGTWAYSMATWTLHGPKPFMDEKKFTDIVDLIDLIEKDWSNDSVRPEWAAWKAEHGIANK